MTTDEMIALVDEAERACFRRDYVRADIIRNKLYSVSALGSHFAARLVDDAIIQARAEDRKPTAVDLMRMAGERAA